MTLVSNIRHFLTEDDEIPDLSPEGKELLLFLGEIVEAASLAYDLPITLAGEICRSNESGEKCLGEIEAWVGDDNNIGWECLECGEDGVISNWVGTIWDRRDYVRH